MSDDTEQRIAGFDLAAQTGWALAEGEIGGKPSIVRVRRDLDLFLGHPGWPGRLVVEWEYGGDDPSGMPTAEMSDAMRVFEDALCPALERDKTAILAFCFTCDGLRHWHFYFGDGEALEARINEALGELPPFPIALSAVEDPEWSEYRAVLRGAGLG